ncbi:hypothetical protein ABDK00_013330 [Niabella insulamsoli]|uniref:hypothetical protein n=1 Tax=Niabella insulamsoli TaxID=3144874 RepID=UPI0031FBD860
MGVFQANSAYDPDVDYSKKGASVLNITFEKEKVTEWDEDLVAFVSEQTGKMKILAKSDLISQVEEVTSFLNTGKPYFISGIGTLTQKADRSLEFHREKYQAAERESKAPPPITEKNTVPQTYIDETRKSRKSRPIAVIAILCLLAIAVTIWFYIKSDENSTAIEESTPVAGEAASTKPSSPTANQQAAASSQPDQIKYILEVTRQPRASRRFNQLKDIKWPVAMETKDSVNYTIYMKLPAANADTTRIKDSLSVLSGRKVWIER